MPQRAPLTCRAVSSRAAARPRLAPVLLQLIDERFRENGNIVEDLPLYVMREVALKTDLMDVQTKVAKAEYQLLTLGKKRRTVTTAPGFLPHPHVLPYDHLVLALGSVTDFRGLRGLPEHALPFKHLGDALRIRNHVMRALEEAAIEEDEELRRRLLTFVVAGGGFSGVEVVAELNDFVREAARSYRNINAEEIGRLCEARPRALRARPRSLLSGRPRRPRLHHR